MIKNIYCKVADANIIFTIQFYSPNRLSKTLLYPKALIHTANVDCLANISINDFDFIH